MMSEALSTGDQTLCYTQQKRVKHSVQNLSDVATKPKTTKTHSNNNNVGKLTGFIWSTMLRPVLFIFYTIESIISILLMYFHIRGFLSQPLDFLPVGKQINHYFFSVCFYVFTVLTMFASINICTGKEVSILKEFIQSFLGFVLHIVISLMTLENAEHDFHIMYLMTIQNEGVEKAVHPFFEYMRSQAVCSLTCGVVYLLHAIIIIDVLLSGSDDSPERADGQESTGDYIPVRLYVFGERFQSHLEKYEWFNDFSRGNQNLL